MRAIPFRFWTVVLCFFMSVSAIAWPTSEQVADMRSRTLLVVLKAESDPLEEEMNRHYQFFVNGGEGWATVSGEFQSYDFGFVENYNSFIKKHFKHIWSHHTEIEFTDATTAMEQAEANPDKYALFVHHRYNFDFDATVFVNASMGLGSRFAVLLPTQQKDGTHEGYADVMKMNYSGSNFTEADLAFVLGYFDFFLKACLEKNTSNSALHNSDHKVDDAIDYEKNQELLAKKKLLIPEAYLVSKPLFEEYYPYVFDFVSVAEIQKAIQDHPAGVAWLYTEPGKRSYVIDAGTSHYLAVIPNPSPETIEKKGWFFGKINVKNLSRAKIQRLNFDQKQNRYRGFKLVY